MPILRFAADTYSAAAGQQAARILSALITSFEVIYDEGGQLVMQCRGSPELFAEICSWGSHEEDSEPEPDEEDASDLQPLRADEVDARRVAPWRVAVREEVLKLSPSPAGCPLALAQPGAVCAAPRLGLCDQAGCPMRGEPEQDRAPSPQTLPATPAAPPAPVEDEPAPLAASANVVPLRRSLRRPAWRHVGQIAAAVALLMASPSLVVRHHGLDLNGDGVVDSRDLVAFFGLDILQGGAIAADHVVEAAWRRGEMFRRHIKVGADLVEVAFEKAAPGYLIAREIEFEASPSLASAGGTISRRCYGDHMRFADLDGGSRSEF